MSGRWPFPADSPTAVRRRVAGMYRARLSEVDPDGCAAIDARMVGWGQGWVVVRLLPFDLGEWLTATEAAELASVPLAQIAKRRREGKLTGRRVGRRWQYRASDVVASFARPGPVT